MNRHELARQLRAHVELLASGGVRHRIRPAAAKPAPSPAPAPTKARQPGAEPAPEPARQSRPTAGRKPVIAPSVALEELSRYPGPRAQALRPLAEQVRLCAACALCESRKQTVFGTGNPNSRLMLVGEAPGADEDAQGLPFVGRAGKLLTDIIEKGMKLRREDVYIANVLKCRPPENRNPEPPEIEACRRWLEAQVEAIAPDVLLALGRFGAQWLTNSTLAIGKLRGKAHEFKGRKVVCTYHPSYVLRNYTLETRQAVFEDIQLALRLLGNEPVIRG